MSKLFPLSLRLSQGTMRRKLLQLLVFCAFYHYAQFMTIGKGCNIDGLVN